MPISYLFLPPCPLLSEIPFYFPPLLEIPLVSKTICLSIGYFLSDSEALAFPKSRTFIYAMAHKRKRVLLTVEQKFQIVIRIEAGETLTKSSKDFGVGVSTVGDMRRDSEKIKKLFYAASNGKSAKLRKTMKCANDEELDNVLYKWFI
ncbi:hypothetical protein AVEN_151396-1 [Araneus ventricosus]|uniref:HTH psq-type domain-containing protein n=1 Tax=Araneus ventricosus TaxID=182803 RepID=A0A4Y1ZK48_ARAVE|nr:hypothetical protein AVEN_96931-1 [Araneus ventricosus]GBM00943.1 hypothetical protein AVEN_151396-1 [Araneus ventricosus]